MAYIDGFVIPVPTQNKEAFIQVAKTYDQMLMDMGATRIVECWGNDIPKGKVTDFYGAVNATPDETVVFSWIEWPDKATRDEGMKKMEALMREDPNLSLEKNPMPFDGMRLIFGGFEPVLELREKA